MKRPLHSASAGFSLLEVAIALVLVVLVGTAATGSLRGGLQSLAGAEETARAADAVREFRESTFVLAPEDLDLLDGNSLSPVMGDGSPLPGAEALVLNVGIETVADEDPIRVLPPGTPGAVRRVTVEAWSGPRRILEASWLSSAR